MCGLSVIVSIHNDCISQQKINLLNSKIKHRGPDGEGYFFGNIFAFGHRRLSIIDLSNNGDQPMSKEQHCIIYNGMIYNYLELQKELSLLGYTFTSKCDTEVILASYQQWGIDAFSKFNGMWAFIIYDPQSNTLVFSRDRFGIKPLYITCTDEYFLAASEIKQFIDFPGFQPVLNKQVAYQFLKSGISNYSGDTFFEGVQELRPGHFLIYDLTTHHQQIGQWYNLEKEIKHVNVSEEMAIQHVRHLFIDSVNIRSKADVKVASCLSGGHDSSSIVTILHSQKIVPQDFVTFTSCYENKSYDEQEYSDAVSCATGFKSVKVFPSLNNLFKEGDIDKMIYQFDQPFGSASHYSEFSIFKEAKKYNIKVILDGQGADEYLCGYYQYFYAYLKELISKRSFLKAWHNLKCKSLNTNATVYSELVKFLKFSYYWPLKNKVKNYFGFRQPSWLLNRGHSEKNNYNDLEGTTGEISLRQFLYSSLGYQLHSQDRNSMLFSIESRLPFLDHRLVEYVMGMPSDYKIKDGYSKHVLLKAINELPDIIKSRTTKMSFAAPDPLWIKENKLQIRSELESAISYTGMFSKDLLKKFDLFIGGKAQFDNLFFRVITFYRFCKIFKIKFQAFTYIVVPSLHQFAEDSAI